MAFYPNYQAPPDTPGFPMLRQALHPRLASLPDDDIEALFARYDLSADEMEGFFDTLKDIGKAVVQAAPAVLPIAGQVIGTVYGGPMGGQIGGAIGQAAGSAIGGGRAPAAAMQPAAQQPAPAAAQPPAPPTPQAPPGSAPSAGALVNAMLNPEMIMALLRMLLGNLGSPSGTVAGKEVPNAAFANLASVLAQRAQAEYTAGNPRAHAPAEYLEAYAAAAGAEDVDPALAEDRAEALYGLLGQAVAGRMGYAEGDDEAYDDEAYDDEAYDDEAYDEAYEGEAYDDEAPDDEAAFYQQLAFAGRQ